MIRSWGDEGREQKEIVADVDSGLVALHMKGVLCMGYFAIHENLQPWG